MRRSGQVLTVYLACSHAVAFAFVSYAKRCSRRTTKGPVGSAKSAPPPRSQRYSHNSPASSILSDVDLQDYMNLTHADFSHLDPLWTELLDRFQGDFDNYNQVVLDRDHGKLPREGGGHEHIHCTLVPVSPNTRLAAFFFDGTPQAIFRFRFYQLVPASLVTGNASDTSIYTVLYTLDPDLERQLRACSLKPLQWPCIYRDYFQTALKSATPSADKTSQDTASILKLLPKCEVQWSFQRDNILHAYAATEPAGAIHAVMVHGQALVESQMMPGQAILIKDQLSLWPNALWIHDRGFEPETMTFIYGNRDNVPYKMGRVTRFVTTSDDTSKGQEVSESPLTLSRETVQDDLQWTLGPDHRTVDEYQIKMDAIGGPSIPPRPAAKT